MQRQRPKPKERWSWSCEGHDHCQPTVHLVLTWLRHQNRVRSMPYSSNLTCVYQRLGLSPDASSDTTTGGSMRAHKAQRVGYIRVSTLDQSTERQLDGVEVDRVFTDKASGKDVKRPQLQAALAYVRDGDTHPG